MDFQKNLEAISSLCFLQFMCRCREQDKCYSGAFKQRKNEGKEKVLCAKHCWSFKKLLVKTVFEAEFIGCDAFWAMNDHTLGWLYNCTLIECETEKKLLLFDCEGRAHIDILDSCCKAPLYLL